MNLATKNLYFGLIGVCVLMFVALLAGVYAADKVLARKGEDVRTAKLEGMVLEDEQRRLAKAKADIEKYQSLAEIARHIVPQDKDQAQTVREIVKLASEHNIKLASITFPSSSLGSKNAELSQLTEVKDIKGVYSLEITVLSSSDETARYDDFLNFLKALERNRRTALVKSISLQPDQEDPSRLQFTLKLMEYIKP
ncbi:hypothetical protein IRY61_03345 [Candidatus Saccharibacteria bacterium]|jgi:hypothetical protein|nr:hypothetical protein [Candidatus Saccharibacteria bacterium]